VAAETPTALDALTGAPDLCREQADELVRLADAEIELSLDRHLRARATKLRALAAALDTVVPLLDAVVTPARGLTNYEDLIIALHGALTRRVRATTQETSNDR